MIDWWSLGIITFRMLTGELPHPTKINKKIPYYIVNYKLPIDENLFSKPAFDFISRLLERDPKKRLGAKGLNEIKNHKFFKGLDWDKLYKREIKPPFSPNNRLFLSETIEGGIEDTPDNRRLTTSNMTSEYFEDFTYPKEKTLAGFTFEPNEE
mmetsp:Transcript_37429/g.43003  ORF Transcript_37429/g.43003 Transcript_37429/m.43003 type:complete len:153 (-) Transcript_37429:69-527(-)